MNRLIGSLKGKAECYTGNNDDILDGLQHLSEAYDQCFDLLWEITKEDDTKAKAQNTKTKRAYEKLKESTKALREEQQQTLAEKEKLEEEVKSLKLLVEKLQKINHMVMSQVQTEVYRRRQMEERYHAAVTEVSIARANMNRLENTVKQKLGLIENGTGSTPKP